jgi:predicted patatin/cPLA2 family phospholipase
MKNLVENDENEYPVPDPYRTIINITTEFSDFHKKSLKEEIMDEIIEKLMEELQNMVKQNAQNELKKYEETTKKNLRRHRNN